MINKIIAMMIDWRCCKAEIGPWLKHWIYVRNDINSADNCQINDNKLIAVIDKEWPKLKGLWLSKMRDELDCNQLTGKGIKKIVGK